MKCPRCGAARDPHAPSCTTCKLPTNAPPDFTLPEHDDPTWRPHGPFMLLKDECSFRASVPGEFIDHTGNTPEAP